MPMKDRSSRATRWVLGVLLAGLITTLLDNQTLIYAAKDFGFPVFSLDARGEPLGEVLKKISKDTGYQITVDSEWAGLPVNGSFKNLTIPQGLRRILAKLNHSIIFNDSDQRISIVIKSLLDGEGLPIGGMDEAVDNSPPGALQPAPVSSKNFNAPGSTPVVPPERPDEAGITKKQLEELEARRPKVDSDDIEITPPGENGEKGFTLKEIKAQQVAQKRAGSVEARPVPPDSFAPE